MPRPLAWCQATGVWPAKHVSHAQAATIDSTTLLTNTRDLLAPPLQVSPHPQCRLRVTVLKETSSGEHMFSVSGVVVSSVDARMERGKIGQWEYDKGKT